MLSLLSTKRRRHLVGLAEQERTKSVHRLIAMILVFVYNMTGIADILSTQYAIYSGAAYEANPVMRAAMDSLSWHDAWIAIKLTLQFTVSAMVLWYPHKTVLSIFAFIVTLMLYVVTQNLIIGGLI